jgi:hypothetical protein
MSSGGGSNKVLWIVLAIVGALVLGCACCAGGIFFFWGKFGSQTMAAAESQPMALSFLTDLGSNNIDHAYGLTTKNFQSRQNKGAFKAMVDRHAGLKSAGTWQLAPDLPNSTADLVIFKATSSGSSVSCTIKMAKDNGQWRVEDFTVP